jgi:hypothetical protein
MGIDDGKEPASIATVGVTHRGSFTPRVARLCQMILVVPLLECGARTGLEVDTPDSSAFNTTTGGANGGSGASTVSLLACPPCPAEHTCSGPWACVRADGCTYGLCNMYGFSFSGAMCDSDYMSFGMCLSAKEVDLCPISQSDDGQPIFDHCVWPPPGVQGACNSTPAASRDQSCGHVHCGPGCTCLCENVCWCGGYVADAGSG